MSSEYRASHRLRIALFQIQASVALAGAWRCFASVAVVSGRGALVDTVVALGLSALRDGCFSTIALKPWTSRTHPFASGRCNARTRLSLIL